MSRYKILKQIKIVSQRKDLLNYGIKRKSTPNHKGYNNLFYNKIPNII